jgi:hypothetical protein
MMEGLDELNLNNLLRCANCLRSIFAFFLLSYI